MLEYTYVLIVYSSIYVKMKVHTNLTIEADVLKEAKQNFINISDAAERGIKEQLGKKEVEIDESINACEFCGRELDKAKASNPNEGLTWLWPDEKWICPNCLKFKSRLIYSSK